MMDINERIEMLEEAAEDIAQAIEKIEYALSGTSQENHADAYIIPHLKTWIGNGNPYDKDIYEYIESLREEEE